MARLTQNLALVEVASHYARQLRGFIGRRVRRSCDVDDVAQEVYLRLLESDRDPRDVEKPLEYVLGVAHHTLMDHFRSESTRETRFPLRGDAADLWGERISEAITDNPEKDLLIRQELDEALKTLPAPHAAALVLCKRDGLSYREIAVLMKRKEDTIRKYIHSAYVALRMNESSR